MGACSLCEVAPGLQRMDGTGCSDSHALNTSLSLKLVNETTINTAQNETRVLPVRGGDTWRGSGRVDHTAFCRMFFACFVHVQKKLLNQDKRKCRLNMHSGEKGPCNVQHVLPHVLHTYKRSC